MCFIRNLNNRGASASDECDIPSWVGAIASAKERVIPSPCARLHRVQDLIEMSADCPLELWSWLVKLSQSCDKIITNREQARRIRRGEKQILTREGYGTFMYALHQFSPSHFRQRQLQIGYITSLVCCYLVNYPCSCSVFCSDQLKSNV